VTAVPTQPFPAPELSFVRRMSEENARWVRRGDYALWCGSRTLGQPAHTLYRLHDNGVVPVLRPSVGPLMHRIPAGTPFYVAHLAGLWHVADADAIWVEGEAQDKRFYGLVLGGVAEAFTVNEVLWVCRHCRHELVRFAYDTRRLGFNGFSDFALAKVRQFNADDSLRTCAKCGKVHPMAYGYLASDDNDQESLARAHG
jgi:hypothetical protein